MSSPRSAGVTHPALLHPHPRRLGDRRDSATCPSAPRGSAAPGIAFSSSSPPTSSRRGRRAPTARAPPSGSTRSTSRSSRSRDLDRGAIDEALGADGRRDLERLRAAPRVDYAAARALKFRVLRAAGSSVSSRANGRRGRRAPRSSRSGFERERAWAEDLALYVALRDSHGVWGWEKWPERGAPPSPARHGRARETLATPILEHHYMQWIAHDAVDARARGDAGARRRAHGRPAVHRLQRERRRVGAVLAVPARRLARRARQMALRPDGQDWGLPAYDWAAMEEDDLKWLRARTRHAARLYDRFRLDHVVGYFRMYVRKPGERGHFDPDGEATQRAHGERVLRAMIEEAAKGEWSHGAGHRRGPRASSRRSSARRSAGSGSRLQGHPVGEGRGARRGARSAIPRSSRR